MRSWTELLHRRRHNFKTHCRVLAFDKGKLGIDTLLERLREYEAVWHGEKDDSVRYRETLQDKPWKRCPCAVCKALGIHVVLVITTRQHDRVMILESETQMLAEKERGPAK